MLDHLLGGAHPARELPVLRQSEKETIVEQLQLLQIRMLDRQREQQNVELAFDQFLGERLRLGFAQMQFEIRIGLAQQRQERWQHDTARWTE